MNRWWRRFVAVPMIGGGFLGILVTAGIFSTSEEKSVTAVIVCALVALIYGYGLMLGVRLAEGAQPNWQMIIFHLIQLPWLASPSFGYHFISGFHLVIGISGGGLAFQFRLGSEWQLSIHQMLPWTVGINLFALIAAFILFRYKKPPADGSSQVIPSSIAAPFPDY